MTTAAPALCLDDASAADGPAIAALLAQPMPGAVRLAIVPSIAACSPRSDAGCRHQAVVVRGPDGRVLAHGARTVRRLWLGGQPRWTGYLAGLRRDPALAGDGCRLVRALVRLTTQRADDEAGHDFTSILTDNARALRVLTGGLPGAPAYQALAEYRTWVVSVSALIRRAAAASWETTALAEADVAEVQALVDAQASDYAPVVDVAATRQDWWVLRRAQRIIGCARLWDRRQDRRVVFVSYAPGLRMIRPLVNLAQRFAGKPTMPPAGATLASVQVAHLTLPDGDPQALAVLLTALGTAARERGCDRVVIGLGAGHPLYPLVDRLPARSLDSRLFTVGTAMERSARCVSPEAALL